MQVTHTSLIRCTFLGCCLVHRLKELHNITGVGEVTLHM